MGNHQSAEAPRRLTKPRTNTSTTNLLAAAAVARRASTLEPAVAANNIASRISVGNILDSAAVIDVPDDGKIEDRPKRRSLFRSKSVVESEQEKPKPAQDAEAIDTSRPLQRYSSVSSLMVDMWEESQQGHSSIRHPRNPRSTTVQDPPSQPIARLSLVVEVHTPEPGLQDESKQLGFQVKQSDDILQGGPMPTPVDNSNHSAPTIGFPIRRRSLLTPGIATRSTSNDNMHRSLSIAQPSSKLTCSEATQLTGFAPNQRRSLPSHNTLSFDHLRQRYYDDSSFTSTALDEITALRPPPGFDSQPRVSTPSDLDYGHIGAFKLGSLRITNGSASPVPGVEERIFWDNSPNKTKGRESRHAEYESTSRKRESRRGRSDGDLQRAPSSWRENDLSPCHTTSEPPKILQTTVEIPSFSLACDFGSNVNVSRQLELETPKSSQELAQAYMQDIASSPFSFDETPSPSPQLEATSKHTAIEDNLFDDESDHLFWHSPSTLEHFSRQPSTSTYGQSSTEQLRLPDSRVGDPRASHVREVQGHPEPALKPLEKADSGYSSKSSLRSFGSRMCGSENETANEEQMAPVVPSRGPPAPPVPRKTLPPPPPKPVYARNSFEVLVASRAVPGPEAEGLNRNALNKLNASARVGVTRASHDSSTGLHQAQRYFLDGLRLNPYQGNSSTPQQRPSPPKTRRSEPPPLPIRSIEENQAAARIPVKGSEALQKPKTIRRQSAPNPSHANSNTLVSKASEADLSASSTKRKLQKPRQAMGPEVVVQGHIEIETGSIPPVSQDAADHLEERLKNFPTLSHTYKSIHKTNSKETLATILSAGSHEVDSMAWSRLEGRLSMLSTASSNADIEQFVSKEIFHQTLAQATHNPMAQKLTMGRRRSAGSLPSSHELASNSSATELSFREFDVVSENVDTSPLEMTQTNSDGNGLYGSPNSMPLKHGGCGKVVAGRTVGMDSQSAAQLARERSRILRRHSSEKFPSSTNQDRVQPPNSVTENGLPMPNLPSQGPREKPRSQKTRSSPPVSMRLRPMRSTTGLQPPPKSTSISHVEWGETPIPNGSQWQAHMSSWREKQRDLKVLQGPAPSGHSVPSTTSDSSNKHSAEHDQHQRKMTISRLPLERQARPPQALVPKPSRHKLPPSSHQNLSFQNQRSAIARQMADPIPSWRDGERSSVDSIAGPNWNGVHRPGQWATTDFLPPVPITVDRYNSGYGYGFERGLGVGGSAGLRYEATAASRKGVEGSLLWGVDFSDVPIVVMRRPSGLEV